MASTATRKGNRGQDMARDLLKNWTHKKMKSTSQFGLPGFNFDPHKGDIVCSTEGHFFPFTVEVKFYKEINFCQLLQPNLKNVLILDFWAQVEEDARRCKKVPMLMMRFNGLPRDFFFVVVTQEFAKLIHVELAIGNPGSLKSLRFHDYSGESPLMILQSNQLFNADYKVVKKIAKTHIKSLRK